VDLFTSNNYSISNVDIYPLTSGSISGAITNGLEGGHYTLVAHYAGDGTFGASNSAAPISVTVNPEVSTTSLSTRTFSFINSAWISASSGYYGDSIVLRADVVGVSGQESATGSITFSDSGSSIGVFPLNTEGYAEDQTGSNVTGAFTAPLAVGTHSFTASFAGDSSYSASSASTPVTFTVVAAPTTTTATPSVTTVPASTSFSVTAYVDTQSLSSLSSGGSSGAAPTGSIKFMNGLTILGSAVLSTAPLDTNGFVAAHATLNGVQLTSTASITAVYPGDGNYTGSTSPVVTVTVSGAPSFALTTSNNGVITVNTLAIPATGTVTVTGTGGFSSTVTLTVASVSPNNLNDPPTCSFGSTGAITLSSSTTSGMGTLTCNTTASTAGIFAPPSHPRTPNGFLLLEVGAAIACIFLLGIAGQKRRGVVLLGIALFAIALVGVSCGSSSGGGGGTGGGNPGTTVGPYTVTINATPTTGTAEQTTFTLNVN